MKITSAEFVKGVIGTNDIFEDGKHQVAFIGRSNVGKSSVINSLTHKRDLAITSSLPGRTQQINVFLINNSFYFIDLPGYGFAKLSGKVKEHLQKMINWYFFDSGYTQAYVVLIIDANIGVTQNDLAALKVLEEHNKKIIIVANKIDKLKKSVYAKQMKKIQGLVGNHMVMPYSAKEKIGIRELTKEITNF